MRKINAHPQAHLVRDEGVAGSNPAIPTIRQALPRFPAPTSATGDAA
jgi:hypothetical protein